MGKLDMSKIKSKQEELQKGSGGYGYDKLKDGKNIRRILPPKGDSTVFYSEGFMHFGLGEDGKTAVACLDTFGKKCPICEYLDSIKDSKSKDEKEFAQRARKTKRIYINVLNRDSDDEDEKPVVLPIGKMILKQVIDVICDPDYGDITDFEAGRDITITRSGKGLNTEYSVIVKPKETVASEQYSEDEMDEMLPDLDTLFVEKSEAELMEILTGEEVDDDDEEQDYDEMDLDDLKYLCKQRGIRIPAKVTKFKLISLLEEDDEAAENADDDAEDEDTPPAKSGKKHQEQEDDEDEGDTENEDDEEDDLMASVKNAVKKKHAGRK
jgi:hypothetical protein